MRTSFIVFLSLITITVYSQTLIFHEDFEAPGYAPTGWTSDSLNWSSYPNGYAWTRLNGLFSQGNACIRKDIINYGTCFLTTIQFSTLGHSYTMLKFSQICKIDSLDLATIEVSADNGNSWIVLTSAQYLGSGDFSANRFSSGSYGTLWQPQTPNNTMWKQESFNVSALIGNNPNAMVRFKLGDGGTPGGNNNFGWCIDDFSIVQYDSSFVYGRLSYDNNVHSGMDSCDIVLFNSGITLMTTTSGVNGYFQFANPPAGFNYVYASSSKPWGGSSATDALIVLRQMVGMPPLLTGLRLQAADVNGDHAVNSLDALMISKRYIGQLNSFPAGEWIMEVGNYSVPQNYPIMVNIRAICVGDVNGSYYPQ